MKFRLLFLLLTTASLSASECFRTSVESATYPEGKLEAKFHNWAEFRAHDLYKGDYGLKVSDDQAYAVLKIFRAQSEIKIKAAKKERPLSEKESDAYDALEAQIEPLLTPEQWVGYQKYNESEPERLEASARRNQNDKSQIFMHSLLKGTVTQEQIKEIIDMGKEGQAKYKAALEAAKREAETGKDGK